MPIPTAAATDQPHQATIEANNADVEIDQNVETAQTETKTQIQPSEQEEEDVEMKEGGGVEPSMEVDPSTMESSPAASPASSPDPEDSPNGCSSVFGVLRKLPYSEVSDVERTKVKWIYRAVNFLTDLFFGVDKDLDHLPEKRRSIQPLERSGRDVLAFPTPSVLPPSISAGYGELSWQGFDKLLYWMHHDAPLEIRLNESSRFLDIGSGFGKCVFHTKLRAKVARSVGIECIKTRHEKASEALHLLRAGFVPGLSDAKDAPSFEDVRDLNLNGCELFEGDISRPEFHPLVHASTHVYAFDVVFSKETHAKILPVVESCQNLQMFGCYLNPQKLYMFGCTRFKLLHTIKVHTTGKQSFTCYFYAKKTKEEIEAEAEQETTDSNDPDKTAIESSTTTIVKTELKPYTDNESDVPPPPATESKLDPTTIPTPSSNSSTPTSATPFAETIGLDPASDAFWAEMHDMARQHAEKEAKAASDLLNEDPKKRTIAAAEAEAAAAAAASSNGENSNLATPKKKARSSSPAPTTTNGSKRKSTTKKKRNSQVDDDTNNDKSSSSRSNKKSSSSTKSRSKKSRSLSPPPPSRSNKKSSSSSSSSTTAATTNTGTKRKKSSSADSDPTSSSVKKKKPKKASTASRSRLFELSMAEHMKSKPKQPRRTNNSLILKLDPLKDLEVPKMLTNYLADSQKRLEETREEEKVKFEEVGTMMMTTTTTNNTLEQR